MKIAFFAFFLPLVATAAVPLKNTPGSGTVEFLAVGRPSMLKIHGTATGPNATLSLDGTQLKGAVDFEMDKLDTGISLRTEHMKEKYLQVKQYPKSTLTLLDAPVDADFAKSLSNGGEKKFRGKLNLHGKDHEVNGTYTAENGDIKAKFPVTLEDYGIDVPKYLGITVANTVDVNVEIPVKK
ncbi:MAG: YceI family protein [Bdellovibrionota bacterium]